MKKLNIINLCLTIPILIGAVFYIIDSSLLLKSILSFGFVLIGAINLFFALKNKTEHKKFAITIFIGLVLAMLGDIVLELHFILGALVFALGHVFFFISYCFNSKFEVKNLIYSAIIFVPVTTFMLFAPIFDFGGIVMQIVCIFYALVISLMTGKAIANFAKNKNTLNLVIMLGSLLFLVSDFVLLLNVFSEISKGFKFMCIATYYPAECTLAYSILKTIN